MSKYLEWESSGPMRGDCTCEWHCILIGNPTVKEICDDIISNDREWGYIGIAKKGTIFGEPNIEFAYGQYVDANRNKIDFNFPEEIANKKVVNVRADGGWSRMDYLLYLE